MLPTLRYFRPSEFKNGPLIDERAALFLDEVRHRFAFPIIVTDDARLAGDTPSGAAQTSLHYAGRAFDLRWIHPAHRLYHFVACVVEVANEWGVRVELELVNSPTDKHIHLALQPRGVENELIVAAD